MESIDSIDNNIANKKTMKCKYCNAEIGNDARFCPNCGKDLSSLAKCVNCGEFLDDEGSYCPHCGAKQSDSEENADNYVEEYQQNHSTRNFLIAFCVLFALIGGILYFTMQKKSASIDGGNAIIDTTVVDTSMVDTAAVDTAFCESTSSIDSCTISDEIDEEEINRRLAFLKSVYAELFPSERQNNNLYNPSFLQRFFTASAMKKFYLESDYTEGDYSYCTEFMIDGNIAFMRPDYGYKVVQREIDYKGNGWMLVTNHWDVVDEPAKIHIKVEKVEGSYKITDIKGDYAEEEMKSATEDEVEKAKQKAAKAVDEAASIARKSLGL